MTALGQLHRIAARLARRDFHSFVEYVGADDDGQPMKQRPLDRLVWHFVEETHAAGHPAGVMLPMGFGKTTQFCYRAAFEIGRDVNLLGSIVTDSVDNSKERVALIRRIIDTPEYRRVFPHVKVLEGHDERSRFTIERDGLSKDPTCSGSGGATRRGGNAQVPRTFRVLPLFTGNGAVAMTCSPSSKGRTRSRTAPR